MANSTSASLKLTVQATGENSGTWGQITNTNLLILEQAIGGYSAVTVNATTGATLTYTNGALSNGKNAVIELTGTITQNVNVTIPDGIEKTYYVHNNTTGNFTVTFKTSTGSGATFSGTDKGTRILYSDGTDIVDLNADINTINQFTLPTSDGTNGQAMLTDGSGNLSFGEAGISTGKAIAMAIVFG